MDILDTPKIKVVEGYRFIIHLRSDNSATIKSELIGALCSVVDLGILFDISFRELVDMSYLDLIKKFRNLFAKKRSIYFIPLTINQLYGENLSWLLILLRIEILEWSYSYLWYKEEV
jgi:hypothetical protein